MSTEWATEKWQFESTASSDSPTPMHEVLTADTQTHIGYVGHAEIAAHICEIHNRTLGDGQDARVTRSKHDNGFRAPEVVAQLERDDPTLPGRKPLRSLLGVAGQAAYDELVRDLPPGRRVEVNHPRGHLPMDLQRDYAPMEFRRQIIRLIEDEVRRRVADYAAREPARIVIDGNPVMMANVLAKLGWTVHAPDVPGALPLDHVAQINQMRENLARDAAEQVPGATEAAEWFDSTQLDAEKPVDNVRRAFLAGYGQGRRSNAANTTTDTLIDILSARGYQVTPRIGGS